jgi:hypothetical protein
VSWADDTGYATGPDGKKRERGSGWSLGDANRVTAGELRAMSPEERRTFMQQAAPGLPVPGSFESAEREDQFSDQFNQGMADILKTLSMTPGTNLANLPPLTKVPQVAARGAGQATKAIDPNKLRHIFGQAKHKLGPLLAKFGGSQEAAFKAVESATQAAARNQGLSGIFTTTVEVGGQNVVVKGRVIDGTAHIGSFWIP